MRLHAWPLIAALALSGCAGSLFKTAVAPPKLYLLNAQPAEQALAHTELPVDLAILKPRVRAGLDTDRIAALYPDQRLDYFADARWSGPVDEVMQDLIVQVFHTRAGMRNVSSDASAFSSMYWLEIAVIDFQAEYTDSQAAPVVHVHLQARIGSSADRRIVGRFEADARQPAQDNRMHTIVTAYNQAANTALAEIAADSAAALGADSKAK